MLKFRWDLTGITEINLSSSRHHKLGSVGRPGHLSYMPTEEGGKGWQRGTAHQPSSVSRTGIGVLLTVYLPVT